MFQNRIFCGSHATRRSFPMLVDPRIQWNIDEVPHTYPKSIRKGPKKFCPTAKVTLKGPLGTLSIPLYEGFSLQEEQIPYSASVIENTSNCLNIPNRQWILDLNQGLFRTFDRFQKEFSLEMTGTTATH